MKTYADIDFYKAEYLLGRAPGITEEEFPHWAMLASGLIRNHTFGRIDGLSNVPEEVRMCCCEVAEKMYSAEAAKEDNGMVLQSYGNDGETGTYKVDDVSEDAVNRRATEIIRKWLLYTGLMYCGVK